MPVPVAAKVGIVAASVAVAAAIAIYEIPEVRRAAEDLRRRIAVALHALGENVDPNREPREPRFNRPEDAEGFYQTHDVDADEETRRRQREELMYWNLRREEQQRDHEQAQPRPRGSTFDDFLSPDRTSDNGTFVYNTGANAWDAEPSNVLRRRGNAEGVRGLDAAAMLANPFSDEHGIELEDRAALPPPAPARRAGTMSSDIYNATPMVLSPVVAAAPAASEVLFDFESHHNHNHPSELAEAPLQRAATPTTTATTRSSATLDRELAEDEYMTAGQDDDAYASIQAWAHHTSSSSANNNTAGFYSPLPHTPEAPLSEPEIINEAGGQHTPTDSASVAGSGVDVAHDDAVSHDDFDAMSESDDDGAGIHTPGSWSEVGSVVSEGESLARA